MGDLLVELDQVSDVDVAVVFLEQRIFAQLVSVGKGVSLQRSAEGSSYPKDMLEGTRRSPWEVEYLI